ncbi:MAG: hypothetical protein GY798_04830, partial [Hyphomicrobiales bacterium]|nr:hypothetical protein [Hyphomicrobiales bacterium]
MGIVSAGDDAIQISSAGDNGIEITDASNNGIQIDHADGNGIFICATGTETGCTPSDQNNGVEIGSVEDAGVSVESAGTNGVIVYSAGVNGMAVSADWDGVYVSSAGNNGVSVSSAGNNGVSVSADYDGVRVWWAGDDGVNVDGDDLAGYFLGNIQVTGSCSGCLLATFGVNVSNETLQPGDIVTIQGMQPSGVDSVPMLMEVAKASEGQAVVGVVQGWAELRVEEEPRPSEIGQQLIPREG